MPRSITIRDVPDHTAAELASRAARSGRSLQGYLRARLIEMADRSAAENWVAEVRACGAATGSRLSPQAILELRELDRR